MIDNFWNVKCPEGFSDEKGTPNYWMDAVRDCWSECDVDTDEVDLRYILNWFDAKRKQLCQNQINSI